MTKTDIKLKIARWVYKLRIAYTGHQHDRQVRYLTLLEQVRERKTAAYEKQTEARESFRDVVSLKHREVANRLSDRLIAARLAVLQAEDAFEFLEEELRDHEEDREHFISEQLSV